VRALYSAGSFLGNTGDTWQFGVPNEAHGAKCNEHRPAVEAALSKAVGRPVNIEFVVSGRHHDEHATPAPVPAPAPAPAAGGPQAAPPEAPSAAPEPAPHVPQPDEEIDLSDLTDAPPESVKTPIDRLAEAFPGSELVSDD
jgi:DNA polymerase-3 subunit gamma/tau